MPLIAVMHCFAFGHEAFSELLASRFPLIFALKDVFGTNDFYVDSKETFFRKKQRKRIEINTDPADRELMASARYK